MYKQIDTRTKPRTKAKTKTKQKRAKLFLKYDKNGLNSRMKQNEPLNCIVYISRRIRPTN